MGKVIRLTIVSVDVHSSNHPIIQSINRQKIMKGDVEVVILLFLTRSPIATLQVATLQKIVNHRRSKSSQLQGIEGNHPALRRHQEIILSKPSELVARL